MRRNWIWEFAINERITCNKTTKFDNLFVTNTMHIFEWYVKAGKVIGTWGPSGAIYCETVDDFLHARLIGSFRIEAHRLMKNEREFLFTSYGLNHPSMNHPLFTNREFLNASMIRSTIINNYSGVNNFLATAERTLYLAHVQHKRNVMPRCSRWRRSVMSLRDRNTKIVRSKKGTDIFTGPWFQMERQIIQR